MWMKCYVIKEILLADERRPSRGDGLLYDNDVPRNTTPASTTLLDPTNDIMQKTHNIIAAMDRLFDEL